jgi:hypothetical protein
VHSYRNANDPESLRQAISSVFAEVASSDGGVAGEDAFELIADLPEGTASAMLESLSTSGNQPIGEAPSMRSADTYAPSPAPSSHGGGRPGATGGSDLNEDLFALFCGALCLLGIPALVIYAIAKAKKK